MGGDHGEEGKKSHYEQPVYDKGNYLDNPKFVDVLFDKPITWFREKIVVPNRKQFPWYHQKFRRVKTIEKCHVEEHDCIYEANEQYLRDKKVDTRILTILRSRAEQCVIEEYPDHFPRCQQLKDDMVDAEANWFTKYGDLGYYTHVTHAFMKQKHRLIWERRHGPIGSGMKTDAYEVNAE